jgi:glycosyltransferase involved in cell wall biosynthesis
VKDEPVKTAVIHDWLVTYAGADKVLEQILACFPDADLFSLVDFLPAGKRDFIRNKQVHTSFIQHLPMALKWFRKCLPLLPLAVEQFDLSSYDLIISSSHSVAKGVITGPDQLHICYCHAPMRYAWDLQHAYLQESGLQKGLLGLAAKGMLHKARIWDLRTANGVDEFIANSQFIARRIRKVYRRESTVIYPPVDIDSFAIGSEKSAFYLTSSRLVPYKRVGLIVEAFNRMPDKRLIVIGDGTNYKDIKSIARNNITIMGFQPFEVMLQHMQRARAFVFAAEEDFGISLVEAQACGTPVIAFGKGGALEIVKDAAAEEPTGMFFYRQTAEAIMNAINAFERESTYFNPAACRKNANRFSIERFCRDFSEFCQAAIMRRKENERFAAETGAMLARQ